MTNQSISSPTIDELFEQLQSSPKGLEPAVAAEREKAQARLFKTENQYKKDLMRD
jgi:hypothetical protein